MILYFLINEKRVMWKIFNTSFSDEKEYSLWKAVIKQITKTKLNLLFDKPSDPNDSWIYNNGYSLTSKK